MFCTVLEEITGEASIDVSKEILTFYLTILFYTALRSCGYPTPGSVQGQASWGFEQPCVVGGVPAQSRGVGTR